MTFKVKTKKPKEKKLGNYKGWEIKKSLKGKTKGLIYAEKNSEGVGLLFGENTQKELKEEINKIEKRKKKYGI